MGGQGRSAQHRVNTAWALTTGQTRTKFSLWVFLLLSLSQSQEVGLFMTPILLRKVKQPIQELQDLTLTLSDGSLPNQEILQKVGMEVKT